MKTDRRFVKILPAKHYIAAVILGLMMALMPSLFFAVWTSSINFSWNSLLHLSREDMILYLCWFVPFGLIGGFWMFFDGSFPPQNFQDWFKKSIRGIFIWGILLGMLIWNLPLQFRQTFAEGFDYGVILVFFISLPMGLVISIVLGYYSVLFVKHIG
jgi:hypothetical protein